MLTVGDFSDSVYLISNGGDNLSRSHLNDVRKALAAAQVRLHVTLLAQDGPISPSESLGAADVRELAYESGGLVMGSLGLATSGSVSYDLAEVKRRAVATQLSLMYLGMTDNDLIEIELPQSVDRWRKWFLELSPATKKLYQDLWIAYPQQLSPLMCALIKLRALRLHTLETVQRGKIETVHLSIYTV